MIKKILNGIFKLVDSLIQAALGPLWTIANSNLPSEIVNGISYISYFFSYVESGLFYVIDMLCIPKSCISLIAYYFIFKLTLPITAYAVKIGVKWYHMLVP